MHDGAAGGELLGFLLDALDARAADEGRSFFSRPGGGTKLGHDQFNAAVTLRSDPTSGRTPGSPWDGEGLPLAPVTWIDKGKLTALNYSRYWAKRQGKVPTGNHGTFVLEGGLATQAELLEGVKRGVLITRFWYTRWVDPQSVLITGLTRDGVFLVENGEVVAPVNNFRFNESPVTMLNNADALTKETVRVVDPGRDLRVPSLRTEGFNLASVSEAV